MHLYGHTGESAFFGAGCFWCTEAVFRELKGVLSVTPGYAGGSAENPTYEEVCSGETGHAEAIKVDYDPREISFADLLTVFFATHDPTTPNRQGSDVGSQYRSVILYATPGQQREADDFVKRLNESATQGAPIVTEVKPLGAFYPAQAGHKEYYKNNPDQPYCRLVINPKLKIVEKRFKGLLKKANKDGYSTD